MSASTLAAAIALFTELGMTREGEASVEGPWVDRVNGLEGVQPGGRRARQVFRPAPTMAGTTCLEALWSPAIRAACSHFAVRTPL
jgi:hypothetical protein